MPWLVALLVWFGLVFTTLFKTFLCPLLTSLHYTTTKFCTGQVGQRVIKFHAFAFRDFELCYELCITHNVDLMSTKAEYFILNFLIFYLGGLLLLGVEFNPRI